MKLLRRFLKFVLFILLLPLIYVFISFILSAITIDRQLENASLDQTIFLNTNGVHLDIIIPQKNLSNSLANGLRYDAEDQYLSFGWGDENFYLETPTWADLTLSNALQAMFLKSASLMHVTRYTSVKPDWIKIKLSDSELSHINQYITNTFQVKSNGKKIYLTDKGYTNRDDFYKANGSYSIFKTCNSWVNKGFKESGLKSCLWTPFDFSLMNKYK